MVDKNGIELRLGDIVKTSGTYFTSDSGYWFVSSVSWDSVWLRKIGKRGNISSSRNSTGSWPPSYYCSDSSKNHAAWEHDKDHAEIELVRDIPAFAVLDHFQTEADHYRKAADDYRRKGWETDAAAQDQYAAAAQAAADRISAELDGKEPPKSRAPEPGIKFFWNGIKVDGGKLIPCHYSIHNRDDGQKSVFIASRGDGRLPARYFVVENHTDSQTDYYDTDHTVIEPDHPLYRYAMYAALKNRVHGEEKYIAKLRESITSGKREPWSGHFASVKSDIERRESWIAEYKAAKDPGQPTAADYAAIEQMQTEAETARLAAEHEARIAAREKTLKLANEGRAYILGQAEQFPIREGEPTVTIRWSESPAFYTFERENGIPLSVAAAEIVLKHYDEAKHAERRGYDKTDFVIRYTDLDTGEDRTYEGRYDLGDNDGGLIGHIRRHGTYMTLDTTPEPFRDSEHGAEIVAFADYLEQFTADGRISDVQFSAEFLDAVTRWKDKREPDAQ